jgi:hypothetical protein
VRLISAFTRLQGLMGSVNNPKIEREYSYREAKVHRHRKKRQTKRCIHTENETDRQA